MRRDVEVRATRDRGRGVFALRDFAPGELIFRRHHTSVGTRADVGRLAPEQREHVGQVDRDRFALVAAPGCYLNHSCDPCAVRHGVAVLALRRIDAGDEITLDYRLNALDGDSWPCRCGTAACTGTVVGSFFALPEDRQAALLEHAPAWIRREHRRQARC
jgi:SET domain-containing protein